MKKISESAVRRLSQYLRLLRDVAGKQGLISSQELAELTGLEPGAVPPIGHPELPLELYVDESNLGNDLIAFNAGSPTDSIVMDRAAYIEVAEPEAVFALTRA